MREWEGRALKAEAQLAAQASTIEMLQQRYDALTGERFSDRVHAALKDRVELAENKADVRGNMLRYIAFVTTGDSDGDPQLGADHLKARAEQADAALLAQRETLEQLRAAAQQLVAEIHARQQTVIASARPNPWAPIDRAMDALAVCIFGIHP